MTKRILGIVLAMAMVLSCTAAFAEEKANAAAVEVALTAVVEAQTVEVGDQFMVKFTAVGVGKYLTYQLSGTFNKDVAELVAPVFEADGFSVIENTFSNDDGTFCIASAGLSLEPNEREVLCSFLFKAKAAGEFTLTLNKEGSNSTLIGRSERTEDGSYFYTMNIEDLKLTVADESGNDEVVLIKDKEPVTSYDDMFGYSWAEKEIGALEKAGILKDIADKSFRPGESITRGDFLLMLTRSCKLEKKGTVEAFSDVPADSYYAEAINIAKSLGIATGTEDNRFLPETTITRQDICALVHRTFVYLNKVRSMDDPENYIGEFTDKDSISPYATKDVAAMIRAKIINGDTDESENKVIRPLSNTTRAEAAIIINRVMIFNILISR